MDVRDSTTGDGLAAGRYWNARSRFWRPHEGVRFVLSRLAQGLLVIIGAITTSFVLIHLTGNPAEVLAGGVMSKEQVHQLSVRLGYERPLLVQFIDYLTKVAGGDLGESFRYQERAITPVMQALPNTLLLVGGATLFACAVAIPMALFSVRRRETLGERALRRILIMGQGTPEYWLGLMLVLVFAVRLGWLPSLGLSGPSSAILPIITLGIPPASMFSRLLRANLLDIMGSDFVIALRSKGMTELEILLHHVLRNALVPFVTFVALEVGWLVGGTIIVENVFVWPGIGTLVLSAVEARDLPVIQAIMIVVAVSYVILNLIVDVLMMWIDPRIPIDGT
jgi:peptide/nickel transport system permease protein